LAAVAGLAAGLALASCGFHPLYGRANPEVVPEMAAVKIRPFTGPNILTDASQQETARVGQELRNLLFTRLNPKGEPSQPKYELNAKVTESKQNLAVQKTEVATRVNLVIDAQYTLSDIAARAVVVSASSRGIASYDIVQSEFANLTASKDAERRALQTISDDMTLRISFYFTQDSKDRVPVEIKPPVAPGPQPAVPPEYRGYPVVPEAPVLVPIYPQQMYPAPGYTAPGAQWPATVPPAEPGVMPDYPGYPSYQPAPAQIQQYQPPYRPQNTSPPP
jgi:LPS-assembly lipoprotein